MKNSFTSFLQPIPLEHSHSPGEKEFRLVLESRVDSLSAFERFLAGFRDSFSIYDVHYINILFTVSEALQNAIVYGNKYDDQKKIFVLVRYSSNQVSFIIEDQGSGFDLDKIEDPTALPAYDKIGHGIFIMRKLSDRLFYSEGGKRLHIVFNLND